jgi:hypothetical protein
MIKSAEKAYCQALLALKRKNYVEAVRQFDLAASEFAGNREFKLLHETTRLLIAVKDELAGSGKNESLEIEEVFSNG